MQNVGQSLNEQAIDPGQRAPRTNLYLAASLLGVSNQVPVTVRNLSSTGALIEARKMLDNEDMVTLVRGSLRAVGSLVWRDGRRGGISFVHPIDLSAWVPGPSGRGQLRVDRIIAESRTHEAVARTKPDVTPTLSQSNLMHRIGEELAFASRRLQALSGDLAEDPAVIFRYGAQLQDLEITTQVLGHLARLMTAEAPETQLHTIGRQDLRRRLERSTVA